jgi:D-threo-aldose 1-dehydrogenase
MRFGLALHRYPRDSFILSTKVGRWLVPDPDTRGFRGWAGGLRFKPSFDYTAAGFEGQHSYSLQRMGLGRIDCLVIHDLEPFFAGAHANPKNRLAGARKHLDDLRRSGFPALQQMRANGVIRAFGAGINSELGDETHAPKMEYDREYLGELIKMGKASKLGHLDYILLANTYTLIHHDCMDMLERCLQEGISIVIGGPYASGILATGVLGGGPIGTNCYSPASPEVIERVGAIERVCHAYGIPLRAAALQFPHGHPAVVSVIPGGKNAAEVASNVEMMSIPIPTAFWKELKARHLLPETVPTP